MADSVVGKLVYEVTGEIGDLTGKLKKAEDVVRQFGDKAKDSLKSQTGSVFKGIAAYDLLKRSIAGAKDIIVSSIGAASDFNESVSKTGVIFGKQQKAIMDFANTADTALGLSKVQALDAASSFAIFGKSAGISGEELVTFSTKLTGLASDLASFNNTTPQDAINAIGAALRGESEPIRRYGVLLDEATLKNRAMQLGIVSTTKEALTPQQRVLAAYNEVLAQTTLQQGDFARTAEGVANKQRILTAQVTNLKTELGRALLPAYQSLLGATVDITKGTDGTNKSLVGLSKTLFQGTNFVIAFVQAFGVFAKSIGFVGDIIGNFAKAFVEGMKGINNAVTNVSKNIGTFSKGIAQLTSGQFKEAKATFQNDFVKVFDFSGVKTALSKNSSEWKFWSGEIRNGLNNVADARDKAVNLTGFENNIDLVAGGAENLTQSAGKLSTGMDGASKSSDDLAKKLLDVRDNTAEVVRGLEEDAVQALNKFGEAVKGNLSDTNTGLADIVVGAEDEIKSLNEQLSADQDAQSAERIRKQIEEQEKILESRKGFEERQAKVITDIRAKLDAAGIKTPGLNLEELTQSQDLEAQIQEKRRVASLDEFTRFEEEQTRKLLALADGYIQEASLLQGKIDKQKELETELTTFLLSNDTIRKNSVEAFADAAIKKYGQMAAQLSQVLSLQQQINNGGRPVSNPKTQKYEGGFVGSSGAYAHAGEYVIPASLVNRLDGSLGQFENARSGGGITNNRNINAPISINNNINNNVDLSDLVRRLSFEMKQL